MSVYICVCVLFALHVEGGAALPPLRAIALVAEGSDVKMVDPLQADGLYVDEGVAFPGAIDELKSQLSAFYEEGPLDRDLLLRVKNRIVQYFHEHRQYSVYISIPEQEISSGIVVCEVGQAKIEEVTHQGNLWLPSRKIEQALNVRSGEVLDVNELLDRVSWLNCNPFHHTEITLSPGSSPGKTNVEERTVDRFPVRAFAGGSNTGTASTGTGRYFAGLTWGNAFFVDDVWTYQFSMSPELSRYSSHTMSYLSFLPCRHMITLSGGYSRIQPNLHGFHSQGNDAQFSFRYKIPCKPLHTPLQQNVYFGADYKYFTNILFFIGDVEFEEIVMQSQVNITQAVLGYQLDYNSLPHQLFARLECFGSWMEWLPHQNGDAYSAMRAHASTRYLYFTAMCGEVYTFSSKAALAVTLRAQGSFSTLLPSEQFQLGGAGTVRGYEQSVFAGDHGVCASMEWRSPPFSLSKKLHDSLVLLGFLDYGWGYNNHPFDGITTSAALVGAGPGLRYRVDPYLEARFDYGFKFHSINFDDKKIGTFHLNVTVGY